jgi:hypothetical protein
MSAMRLITLLLLGLCLVSPLSAQNKKKAKPSADVSKNAEPHFVYDTPDTSIPATTLEQELFYEPGILWKGDDLWLAWLEFLPGKGDVIWIGCKKGQTWKHKEQITEAGAFAKPTLTADLTGKIWLTYEAGPEGNWGIFICEHKGEGKFGTPQKLSPGDGSNINHTVAANPKGGLWIVWQSDRDGQFDIVAAQFNGKTSDVIQLSENPLGDWQPSAAVNRDGDLFAAWDSYDGKSYNVMLRSVRDGKPGKTSVLSHKETFEGRASGAADRSGRIFVSWEEDGPNWGKHYTARQPGDKESTKIGDTVGPVHRFRRLHLAEVDPSTLQVTKTFDLPQPALDLAAHRPNRPGHVQFTGAFYERAQWVIDGQDRPWIVYRHYYTPWMGMLPIHHTENDWGIYARCWLNDGWSELIKFDIGQGDGMQLLSLSPTPDGFVAAWTTGRTDRKDNPDRPRGVAMGRVTGTPTKVSIAPQTTNPRAEMPTVATRSPRPTADKNGTKMELFFGDLHRHTDLSLCYTPSDGTIEDAYRYAIDAAPLDFLGITDHTHDLQMGEPLSHVWWRALKETDRHKLANKFITFYSYERSRGDTDHNVISLRRDMMRPHTYPLPDFWQELDSDTFTMPHEPFNPALWKHKDNVHRPLMEIYQGYRHMSAEDAAAEGLSKGHEVGFIASSDHLSTSASFACVWAEKPTRESIFRAMQARRTYGATAKIILKVTSGKYWMGEKFETKGMEPIRVQATPTGKVEKLDLFVDGKIVKTVPNVSAGEPFTYDWNTDPSLVGAHIFYTRITQADGNRAWSSPLWVTIQK